MENNVISVSLGNILQNLILRQYAYNSRELIQIHILELHFRPIKSEFLIRKPENLPLK